ncbi:MAG TPA: polyamine aminopropyltransferase [Rubrobacteraceae bacterium]|jgi:spermidine synthase|nr:polyamine aminopropyltransferase [Rubrobacteraceae bacterium]
MTNSAKKPSYFTEAGLPYGREGIRISVLVNETLLDAKSEYGHIQVFDTAFFGKMLVIDGIIQTTVYDEFVYHEMMVILASLRIEKPQSILIIGGGDGGAIKQALRVKSLKRIVMAEIDMTVIDVSREFLPEISDGAFDDPRVELIVQNGAEYVRRHKAEFDLVVLDSTDPVPRSPAEYLFTEEFYHEVKDALEPGGVVALHGGSITFQPAEVTTLVQRLRRVFKYVDLYPAIVPAYQLSLFGFINASDQPQAKTAEVERWMQNIEGQNKYLSSEVYETLGVLPPYIQKELGL